MFPLVTASRVRLSEVPVWDEAKGELRILGKRYAAIDVESLCQHLEALVGVQVAEVIIDNHETRLGRQDAARVRQEKPQATLSEIVSHIEKSDRLSGMGITTVTFPETSDKAITVEMSNPVVKATVGAAKSFMFSYWKGVLSVLLGKEFDMNNVIYDETKSLLKCQFTPRPTK